MILASGTASAQLITLLATPAVTRLYSPAEVGALALFLAVVSVLVPALCGRFEAVLVIVKSGTLALQSLGISLLWALALSLLCQVIIVFFFDQIAAVLSAQSLGIWLAIVPFALLLNGIVVTFTYYSNRLSDYGLVSRIRILQSGVVAFTTIGLGVVGIGIHGLLLGTLTGLILASASYGISYRQIINQSLLAFSKRKLVVLRKYREFPIFNASTALLDGFYQTLPLFFIAYYFSESVAGFYALMLRMCQTPLSILSSAIFQVHLRVVSDLVNAHAAIRPHLAKLTVILFLIAVPVAFILTIASPDLFAYLFGEQWREAGEYAQILMPAIGLRFVVSSVSSTFWGTATNRLVAIWKVTALVITGAVLLTLAPRLDIKELLMAMLVTDILLYLLQYLFIWKSAAHRLLPK